MVILKCIKCGGEILLSEDRNVVTCGRCGCTMTFSRASDGQKLTPYNRAYFLRQNEFGKAAAGYGRILNQDDTGAHGGVVLGHYPQTIAGNDSTEIEWMVLAKEGNKALLVSRYGLDAQPYNREYANITWEKCTLRSWLNGTFLDKAFTAREQAGIELTNLDNSGSQGYGKWSTSGGNDTQDKIFLLSYAEANKYLGVTYDDGNNTKSRVSPTAYAIMRGAYTNSSHKTADGVPDGRWWLRSPGLYQTSAANVDSDGALNGYDANSGHSCVRPALWINLEADIF